MDAMKHVTQDMAHESAGGESAAEMQPCFDIVCITTGHRCPRRIPGKPDPLARSIDPDLNVPGAISAKWSETSFPDSPPVELRNAEGHV